MKEKERDPACEECGYSLVGVGGVICPECGEQFDAARPWRPAPWPPAWRVAVKCIGPLVLVLVCFVSLGSMRATRNAVIWPFWVVWLGALVVGVLVPVGVAGAMGRACEPRVTRAAAARRVWAPALAVNAVLAGAALAVFVAFLR